MEKISVLIPSYNEARTIGGIVRELKGRGLSVCVIDDGSTDQTASIAEKEGAVVIRHEKNKGKGASLREGFRCVLKGPASAVLVMDGDRQHDTADADSFLRKMDETGADIVIGNRMLDTSSMPVTRKVTNKFMSFIVSKMCGHKMEDTQCGFRLIKRAVLESIKLQSSNYEIESELLLKAARKGFKIESVPIKTLYADEQSRINPVVDAMRFIALIVKIMVEK